LSVPSSHTIIANNILVNCYSYQIQVAGDRALITGNQCWYLASPVNPSAAGEPDYVYAVKPEAGIVAYGTNVSIVGNVVDGGNRGILTVLGYQDGSISGNTVLNTTYDRYGLLSATNFFSVTTCPDRESRFIGTRSVDNLVSATLPTAGYYPVGSRWSADDWALGAPDTAVVYDARKTATSTTVAAGEYVLPLSITADFDVGVHVKIGVELDNNTHHWSYVTDVSASNVTMAAAIPAGRSVVSGGKVYVVAWHYEPAIEASRLGGSSSAVLLTSDSSTAVLAVTLPNLLPSRYYTATLGSRIAMWRTATPLNSGSVDLTQDIAIQTDSSSVATVTLLGTAYVDTSRLPTELVSATMTVAASTGGFTISATRTPGVNCTTKAKWWLTGLEDLGAVPS